MKIMAYVGIRALRRPRLAELVRKGEVSAAELLDEHRAPRLEPEDQRSDRPDGERRVSHRRSLPAGPLRVPLWSRT
jgi:hypothetical protein